MLVRNQIDSLYNGVNQQSAVQRLHTQCEEMINAYPLLNSSLLKRNPTSKIELSETIEYSNDMFHYAYDRGDTDAEDENYAINITSSGIEVIDVVNGNVFNESNGKLTYDTSSCKTYVTSNFGGKNGYACLTIKDTTFVVNKNVAPKLSDTLYQYSTNKKLAFIWLSLGEPNYGFTYIYKLTNSMGTITGSITETNTQDAANAMSSSIKNAAYGFTASVVGSVIKISSTSEITVCEVTDSYGNTASKGFIDTVNVIDDLPSVLGFPNVVIKVEGTANTKSPYYVKYVGDGTWEETMSGVKYLVDSSTMPHILIRNSDNTFTFKEYGDWQDRTVGDDDVTPIPSIFEDDNTIKDIFFLRNRLGFITSNNVVLSEVAQYGNFFRTTALSTLDSDPIDIIINSTKALNLEYAVNMEDSLMITSDKLQFRLKQVDVLTPDTIAFIQSTAYEISKNVRPVFMNNRVFFVVERGGYSAVMEFYVSTSTNTIAADDITAHCQSYIDSGIDSFTYSSVNNMLFLSSSGSNVIYCYKYYDRGNERVQSAWFKWIYNGEIYSTYAIGKRLIILIKRYGSEVQDNWILNDGTWDNFLSWTSDGKWNMSLDDINKVNQVEQQYIFPQEYTETFLDNGDTIINVDVLIGEWIVSSGENKDIGSNVSFKTIQIDSMEDSSFNLYVNDLNRNTTREVEQKYTVGRKPFVGGNTKNIKVGIKNDTEYGFSISAIVFEGDVNQRSRRI